jgi:hypothetical protein
MGLWRRGNRFVVVIGLAGGAALVTGIRSDPMQTLTKPGAEFGVELQTGHALDTRQGRETAFADRGRPLRSDDFNSDFKNDFKGVLVAAEDFTRLSESPDAARTELADTFARTLRLPPRPDGPDVMLIERETVFKQSLEASDSPIPDLQMLSISGISPLLSNFAYGHVGVGGLVSSKRLVGQGTVVPDAVVNIGGYVALYREGNAENSGNVQRALGVFALRSEIDTGSGNWQTLLLHITLNTTLKGATLNFGYHLPLQHLPEGTRFRQTFLLMRARSGVAAPDCFTQMQRQFGLDGRPPAYMVTMETGTITSSRFPLDLAATDGAVVVDLAQTDLPCDLPVRASGLHDNWTAVCADLPASSKAVPLAPGTLPHHLLVAFDGMACTALDLNAHTRRLFLGHPAICDRPAVGLSVTAWNPKGLTVKLHNPTARPVTVRLRIHPRLGFGRQTLQIPARTSVTTLLSWQ